MKRTKIFLVGLCIMLMALNIVSGASALVIDTATLNPPVSLPINPDPEPYAWGWVGNANSNNEIVGIIEGLLPAAYSELYKENSNGTEDFTLAGSYDSTITSNDATINYTGGPFIGTPPSAYVLVKDGNADPNWYLINLGAWDGQETIVLNNFFEGEFGGRVGSISHVSLWGTGTGTPIPEPSTLLLLGSGLVGLSVYKLRKRSK